MGLKERLYSSTAGPLGARLLDALARRVEVPELGLQKRASKHPLLVAVTIDTEAGFVDASERRVWQSEAPEAWQGFIQGVPNLSAVLAKHDAPATWLVAPHFLSAPRPTRERSLDVLRTVVERGSEVGLHLHPASDRALATRLGRSFAETSGPYLSQADKHALVSAGKQLLEESRLGEVTSFRWGNWGLDAGGARAVAAAGFTVDSSAVPGMRDRKQRHRPRFDWSATRRATPWRVSLEDPAREDPTSALLELPIATFDLFGMRLRADALFGKLLEGALRCYRDHAPRDDAAFAFVLMTHSSEATREDGTPTRTLHDLDAFLALARSFPDVELVTLREAARRAAVK